MLPKNSMGDNIFDEVLYDLENWCKIFNRFAVAFFLYMKFLFSFILISIGILTLFKLRGIYKIERTKLAKTEGEDGNMLKRPRLVLGSLYIMMGIGILFNFFTYFLIIVLDPLPDRFIFEFINFSGKLDPKALNRIQDLNAAKYPQNYE